MPSPEGINPAEQMIDSSFGKEDEIPVPTKQDFDKYRQIETPPHTEDGETINKSELPEFRSERLKNLAAIIEEQKTSIKSLKRDNDALRRELGSLYVYVDKIVSRINEDRQTLVDKGLLSASEFSEESREHLRKVGYPGVESKPKENRE